MCMCSLLFEVFSSFIDKTGGDISVTDLIMNRVVSKGCL